MSPSTAPTPAGAGGLPPLPDKDAANPRPDATTAPAAPVASPAPASALAAPPPITPGTLAECKRAEMGIGSRRDALGKASDKDTPAVRAVREVLDQRDDFIKKWRTENEKRTAAEHPEPNPEQLASKARDDLKEAKTLLDGLTKTPDALLPEAFRDAAPGSAARPDETRLAEMKEALDSTRQEAQNRANDPDKAATEAGKPALPAPADLAALRAGRDKSQQALSALAAARAEREAAINAAAAPEARELARDRYVNFEWEYRVEAERLALAEARIQLANRMAEARSLMTQGHDARTEYERKILDLMEKRYAAQSERQQRILEQAVVREEARAAQTADVLERYRAKRSAELLELEAQATAFEKALATTHGNLAPGRQKNLADETVKYFEDLKTMLNDGTVSPLDVLRLKTAFRRIGPLRTSIVRGDLATNRAELTTYENALSDAEISLINDARDDRYDRESLLEKLPEARHAAAVALLDAMEARHLALLHRLRDVLDKLAKRAEETQGEINRRVRTLDEEYAFIRTHIFWIRDAEPVGPETLGHARSEAGRTLRALVKLAWMPTDRNQWGRLSPDFVVATVGLIVLPWPLRLGQRALDRRRVARASTTQP